jgi:hypothetical protein
MLIKEEKLRNVTGMDEVIKPAKRSTGNPADHYSPIGRTDPEPIE